MRRKITGITCRIGCVGVAAGTRPVAAQVHGRWMPGTSGVYGRSISVTSSVRVRVWLDALGQRLCLLVCAGQRVLRTVSVVVRGMGRPEARGPGTRQSRKFRSSYVADAGGSVSEAMHAVSRRRI